MLIIRFGRTAAGSKKKKKLAVYRIKGKMHHINDRLFFIHVSC